MRRSLSRLQPKWPLVRWSLPDEIEPRPPLPFLFLLVRSPDDNDPSARLYNIPASVSAGGCTMQAHLSAGLTARVAPASKAGGRSTGGRVASSIIARNGASGATARLFSLGGYANGSRIHALGTRRAVAARSSRPASSPRRCTASANASLAGASTGGTPKEVRRGHTPTGPHARCFASYDGQRLTQRSCAPWWRIRRSLFTFMRMRL